MIWIVFLVILFLSLLVIGVVYYVNKNRNIGMYKIEFKRRDDEIWQSPMCFFGYTMADNSNYIWANINNKLGRGWLVNTGTFIEANSTPQSSWDMVNEIRVLDWSKQIYDVGYQNGYFIVNNLPTKVLRILADGDEYDIRLVPGSCT